MTDWNRRLLELARYVSIWSKDPSSQIGAVIARPDHTIASTGYNGFARQVSDDPSLYADRDFKIATVVHAEANAIITAREPLHGYAIYVSGLLPCAQCASLIIQSGIKHVFAYNRDVPERWRKNMQWGAENLRSAGVSVSLFDDSLHTWI